MIRDLGFNRMAAGFIFNAHLFSYILFTPLTGYLTDRFGDRQVITTCAFILGTGIILMGTSESLWTTCVFCVVVGFRVTDLWTPFYGLPAILSNWKTAIIRDTTESYAHSFIINAVMAALGIIRICAIKKSRN